MMRRLLISVLLITSASAGVNAQNKGCGQAERSNRRYIARASKQPHLGVDYGRVAKLKLASRKTTYRLDELMSLDLALLNTAATPVFSKDLTASSVRLTAQRENGARVRVFEFVVQQPGAAREQYGLLNANGMIAAPVQLLVGCEVEAAFTKAKNESLNESRMAGATLDPALFEHNLFVTWGDFCLNAVQPGKYVITAEVTNEFVLGSPCEPNIKTMVGTLRSAPLTITIME